MNILHVCCNFDPITGGGEAERTLQMCKALLASGISCKILTTDTGLTQQRRSLLGTGIVIALPCISRRFYIPWVSPKRIKQLVAEADVVHLIGHWNLLNALVYWAARRNKTPYVVCPAGAASIFGRSKLLKRIYNRIVGTSIFKNAEVCISVTEQEATYLVQAGARPGKVLVIQNAISASDFYAEDTEAFRKKFKLNDRQFILFVGRLNEIKGPDLLLEAFHQLKDLLPDVDLLFVGPDGGMLNALEASVQQAHSAGRVRFIGYLGGSDKTAAYKAAEILVIPSRLEAMSIVALEAGICGTPVVLTDQCGFGQLSEVGGGWVVSATAGGLAEGILNVFNNPGSRQLAANAIKRYVAQRYTWDAVVLVYKSMYEEILDNSGLRKS
jgi:glycosyltransferase involved in cell wall biosynthesis